VVATTHRRRTGSIEEDGASTDAADQLKEAARQLCGHDWDEVGRWYAPLHVNEVLAIIPLPRLPRGFVSTVGAAGFAALRNGAQVRTLYLDAITDDTPSMSFVQDLVAAGAEARTSQSLPIWLTILGRRIVAMPRDPDGLAGEAVLVQGDAHVRAAVSLFTLAWEAAQPLSEPYDDGETLTSWERKVLVQLATGTKDETGARRLGVSPRTYRRHVTELCSRLGASSRFQAGVLAARAGLV
jgi:DNA-binding CsgD family transcriptional regulator